MVRGTIRDEKKNEKRGSGAVLIEKQEGGDLDR